MTAINEKCQLQSLTEVIDKDDDWSGMDSAARRKRQNRLNQRAYRRRKARQAQPEQPQPSHAPFTWLSAATLCPHLQTSPPPPNPHSQISSIPACIHPGTLLTRSPIIPYLTPSTPHLIHGPIIFPLTPDHLIPLIQYNVLRATLTNLSILSLLHEIPFECSNALAIAPQGPPESVPDTLWPTELQKVTPHGYWIDILPLGKMRDNLILLEGTFDQDDLCSDMVGGLFEGYSDLEMRGMLIWGEPWRIDGWEVTEGFLRKWGWLLKGCDEMIEASNRWRGLRGEEPLVVEV